MMAVDFDPYHAWLGISRQRRSLDYYTLLGLRPFEADLGRIQSAFAQRLAYVRQFAQGPTQVAAQRVALQLQQAGAVLLNPEAKHGYDQSLTATLRAASAPAPAQVAGPTYAPAADSAAPPPAADAQGGSPSFAANRSWHNWAVSIVAGLIFCIAVSLLVAKKFRSEAVADLPTDKSAATSELGEVAIPLSAASPSSVDRSERVAPSGRELAPAFTALEAGLFEKIAVAIDEGLLEKSQAEGAAGGSLFEETVPTTGLLTGVEVYYKQFAGNRVIGKITPVYQTPTGRWLGASYGRSDNLPTRCEAKPGYAVGGLQVQAIERLVSIQLSFMRVTANGLDTSDSYVSEWLGGNSKLRPEVRSQGKPVIGLHGSSGAEMNALGLMFADTVRVTTQPMVTAATEPADITASESAGGKVAAVVIPNEPGGPPKLDLAVHADVTSGPSVPNATPATLPRPADATEALLASKARKVLETHCYRCHGKDGVSEGGLNFVLDSDKLVANRYVAPLKAATSPLVKRILDGSMPPPKENRRPTEAEISALSAWIIAGAPSFNVAPVKRDAITPLTIVKAIRSDLDAVPESDRPFVRYFTLSHLYNAQLSNDELETYRLGLSKLVNSLSWGSRIVRPTPIDAAKTILRIDLRDYKWNEATWNKLLAEYPFGVKLSDTISKQIVQITDCELPYLRADWFVATVALPPLYHEILELPETERELENLLHISIADNIRQRRVTRIGFSKSGIARQNRLIERHETFFGAYWRSYDFERGDGAGNLFARPLGPGIGRNDFQHAGGEIIFNLPNGMQAYLLINAKGQRINKAPIELVSDPRRPDRGVVNGLSCMSCHVRGLNQKTDEIRETVKANRSAFTSDELKEIAALYPDRAEAAELQNKDIQRFVTALTGAGAPVTATEPIFTLAQRFESPVDMNLAAAELGVSTDQLNNFIMSGSPTGRDLLALRLAGGAVPRELLTNMFASLVKDLSVGDHYRQAPSRPRSNVVATTPIAQPSAPEPRFVPRAAAAPSVKFGGGEAKLHSTIKLGASVSDLIVSRDRRWIFFLNASEGRVQRIDTKTQELDSASIEAATGAERMTISPDGKLLYVGAAPSGHNSQNETSGQIQIIDAEKFVAVKKFTVPFDPWALAAASGGVLYVTGGSAQWNSGRIVDTKRGLVTGEFPSREGADISLAHDQKTLYVNSMGTVDRLPVPPTKERRTLASSQEQTGPFVVSPDSRFLFGKSGAVLRLSKAPGADLQRAGKIDKPTAFAFDESASQFFVATDDKQIKVFSYPRLEASRQFSSQRKVAAMALDAVGGMLYCFVGDADNRRAFTQTASAGDIAIFNVSGVLDAPEGAEAHRSASPVAPSAAADESSVKIAAVEAVPGGGKLVDNELQPIVTLKLGATISEMLLARDRQSLFILNSSEGQLQRLDTAKVQLDERAVELTAGANCAAITPNGRFIYIGASPKGSAVEEGKIQEVSVAERKVSATFPVPFDPHNMVADKRGFIYATQGSGSSVPSHIIDPRKKVSFKWGQGVNGKCTIRFSANERIVYVGGRNDLRRRETPNSLPRDLNMEETRHWMNAQEFEIVGDGKYLVAADGQVLRLSEGAGADLKPLAKIDEHLAVASDRGCNRVFVATKDKMLKIYDLPQFELRTAVVLPRPAIQMKLDATQGRLYCSLAVNEVDRFRNQSTDSVANLAVFDVTKLLEKLQQVELPDESDDEVVVPKADPRDSPQAQATTAAHAVAQAQLLIRARKGSLARKALERVVNEYPETKAADRARELLKSL